VWRGVSRWIVRGSWRVPGSTWVDFWVAGCSSGLLMNAMWQESRHLRVTEYHTDTTVYPCVNRGGCLGRTGTDHHRHMSCDLAPQGGAVLDNAQSNGEGISASKTVKDSVIVSHMDQNARYRVRM